MISRNVKDKRLKIKDSGQIGYFYKGELKIREPSQPTEGSLVFVRGGCQLNPGQNAANSGSNGHSRKVNKKF